MKKIKNIAIIAHVDHGKTTLIDAMLRQSGLFRKNQDVRERMMDSEDLERERGITIFSKNASFDYKGNRINIVDTPGHSDFGGEVQRIMKMVDSVLLLVDAVEGPMPQTKYVLKKSLELGLKPIVVINKIDRPNSEPHRVVAQVFDLFLELNATEEQLEFPVVYASARDGYAKKEITDKGETIIPLMETILDHVEDTTGDRKKPFQFMVSAIEYNNYVGKIVTGKIYNGSVSRNDEVLLMKRDGSEKKCKVSVVYVYEGMMKKEVESAYAGDIVSIAGIDGIDVGETLCDLANPEMIPSMDIDEPTISMTFSVNNSPFAGRVGQFVTSRNLRERLERELQSNVSLKVEYTGSPDEFIVKGRGELQLSILIETMRREGYEFQVSKPEVIFRERDGKRVEPYETAMIDVADEYVGAVMEMFGKRKGEIVDMSQGSDGYSRLEFMIPARGLIGFSNEFMTITRGTGIINHSFYDYEDYKGELPGRSRGVLISMDKGVSVAYALDNLQNRGTLFIGPGEEVYGGMIIGENSREDDLVVNVQKGKKLTNVRASGSDDAIKLSTPRTFSIEQALEFIGDDELLEVTPKNFRLRKRILDHIKRKQAGFRK